jgi:hypothetical protein
MKNVIASLVLMMSFSQAMAIDSSGFCQLTASVITADRGYKVFKTTADHYVGGRLALPAHSLVYTTGPDSQGVRRIKGVWIGKNWSPGLLSVKACDQPAAGMLTPTGDRYTFTARFSKMGACYVSR